ncbi:MAG: hypothetical protein IJM76_01950 [Lachnospiraceae bacterium]|nr:hypothetical protein [Lachnospiraceae bacterium]
MENFWDPKVWGSFNLIAVLLISLLIANALKKTIRFLQASLIPTSVLGGAILLAVSGIFKLVSGKELFDTGFFGGNGTAVLEMITYHTLALGFIATTFKSTGGRPGKKRISEIFNTGATTVSSYLIQALVGLAITMTAALFMKDFFKAAGVLLAFGYGQGTGQALNYGGIYESSYGFTGGKSFGLTIAALGFLSASIGGVIHLNILRRRGRIKVTALGDETLRSEDIQKENEVPMQGSIDKMTLQVALIFLAYLLAYLLMMLLGRLLPGMRAVVYGFNFLLGVLSATLIKGLITLLKKANIIKKEYRNDFLMTRAGNFFFDVMVVAGIAAIRLSVLENYWGVILILGAVGAVLTYFYNRIIAKKLFPNYVEEQFLMMYGMLTGTASTGIILLREIDGDFRTPAADNMVYQNFPAIALGFPMMLLATLAPEKPVLTMIILAAFFLVLQFVLFRSYIFKKKTEKK